MLSLICGDKIFKMKEKMISGMNTEEGKTFQIINPMYLVMTCLVMPI